MNKKGNLGSLIVALIGLSLTPAMADEQTHFSESPHLPTLSGAFKLYQEAKFSHSYEQFSELMRLGNQRASAQLGLMTLAEEGTSYDPVQAWAYFQHAGDLGFADGYGFAEEVYEQLSPEQREATTAAVKALQANMLITRRDVDHYRQHDLVITSPKPQRRIPARYPRESVYRGEVGYVVMYILIDTDGRVAAAETIFSSNRDFERAANRTLRHWRYEPPEAPIASRAYLEFSLNHTGDRREPYLRAIEDNTWAQSVAGNPGYQSTQAAYLLNISQPKGARVQPETFSERPPTLDDMLSVEQQEGDEPNWPQNWTSGYWFRQAAQSGERTAQRFLAYQHDEWADYLLNAGHARMAAWITVNWLHQNENPELHAKGLRYLEYLKDSDDEVTRDIVNTLSAHFLNPQS